MSLVASPFTSSDALNAWEAINCDRCVRTWDEDDGYRCPIQLALRCAVPGPLAGEIAARVGYVGPAGIRPQDGQWRCREAARIGFPVSIGRRRREEMFS